MVLAIRNIEKAMGDAIKQPSPSEKKNISVVRKSIVAKKRIKKGEMFSIENVIPKRPGNGISPMRWDEIIGSYALKDYNEDEVL